MIAAVHISPWITLPGALVVLVALGWYWFHLGREHVPAGRRKVRRLSIVCMTLALPAFVRGLSYIDPDVHRPQYVAAWSIAILLMMLLFFTACADVLVTLRVQRKVQDGELRDAAGDIGEALRNAAEREKNHDGPAA